MHDIQNINKFEGISTVSYDVCTFVILLFVAFLSRDLSSPSKGRAYVSRQNYYFDYVLVTNIINLLTADKMKQDIIYLEIILRLFFYNSKRTSLTNINYLKTLDLQLIHIKYQRELQYKIRKLK